MGFAASSAQSNREIFLAAVDVADEQQRRAFLEEACGGEAERVCEIQRLLAAHHDGAASPVDLAIRQLGPAETRATGADGSLAFDISSHPTIDRYKLLEQVGEGGMGTVFMAQQNEPIRRKVALKLIKPGMDSREVISRFQAERQALAMMDHPNIARVLDAGTTAQEALSKVGLDGMRRMIREDDPP
jgi:eukaryotic-like serine/threonine-protein kinase